MADFNLGRLKFNWRGAWSATTAYVIDDIVKFGGNTYICIAKHTSAASESAWYTTDTANWNVHVPGYEVKGSWTASTFYKLNDLVTYGNTVYYCTTQHTSSSTFDASKFTIYLQGLKWEDSWSSSTEYQPGDIVSYAGYTYTAKTINTNVAPNTSNTAWGLLIKGLNTAGTWSGSSSYKEGDVVQYGGYLFVCIVANTGVIPTADITKWTQFQTGIKWVGNWSAVTDYRLGEIVYYNSSAYINIQEYAYATAGAKQPDVSPAYWSLFALGSGTNSLNTSQLKAAALSYAVTFSL